MTIEIWYTATIEVETERGTRYQGVTYTPGGRSWRPRRFANSRGEQLPPKAIVKYRSPLRLQAGYAYELARSRTIHHNLYHGENPASNHYAADCHER